MKPGELYAGIPWHDGKVIYRGGDAAVPMAIAVTDNDAAAIVTALASWNLPESDHRNWWIEHCVTDLAAMNSGYVSRLRDEDLPAYMRDALVEASR